METLMSQTERQRYKKEGKTEGKNGRKPRQKIKKRASVTCAERERRRGRDDPLNPNTGLQSKVRHLRRSEKTEGGEDERWRNIEGG